MYSSCIIYLLRKPYLQNESFILLEASLYYTFQVQATMPRFPFP